MEVLLEETQGYNGTLGEPGGKPEVRFDMPCTSASYNPSEFEGISPTFSNVPNPPVPIVRGLAHVKARLPLFDADLSVFDCWYARLDTNLGSYNLGAPRRIERDLRPGAERIKLDFIRLPVIKHAYVKRVTIFNSVGDAMSVQEAGYWMHPGDFMNANYTLNV